MKKYEWVTEKYYNVTSNAFSINTVMCRRNLETLKLQFNSAYININILYSNNYLHNKKTILGTTSYEDLLCTS